jgi:hypothetical protein
VENSAEVKIAYSAEFKKVNTLLSQRGINKRAIRKTEIIIGIFGKELQHDKASVLNGVAEPEPLGFVSFVEPE